MDCSFATNAAEAFAHGSSSPLLLYTSTRSTCAAVPVSDAALPGEAGVVGPNAQPWFLVVLVALAVDELANAQPWTGQTFVQDETLGQRSPRHSGSIAALRFGAAGILREVGKWSVKASGVGQWAGSFRRSGLAERQ